MLDCKRVLKRLFRLATQQIAIGWNVFLAGAQNTGAINPSGLPVKRGLSVGSESPSIVAAEVME